jgi:murein DD-endopeptidase MepM/ murein hydrolase activator NlpD
MSDRSSLHSASFSAKSRKPPGIRLLRGLLLLIVLIAVPWLILAATRVGSEPQLEILPALPGIGQLTAIKVKAAEPGRGLSSLEIDLVQGDTTTPLAAKTYAPRPFWKFWGDIQAADEVVVEVGRRVQKDLQRGEATIRVRSGRAGTPLRKPPGVEKSVTLPVRFTPPRLEARSPQPDVAKQGGSGVVIYASDENAVRHGVKIGSWEFPGSPLPGDGAGGEASLFFAFYGVPYLEEQGLSNIKLFAADALGNQAERTFLQRYDPRSIKADDIGLDDKFLGRVVPEIIAATPSLKEKGNLLEDYLQINRDLRKENEAGLIELSKKSRQELLWHGPFRQLPNGQVMAGFAEKRTYVYGGAEVDTQYHLGYDLASNQRSPVPAAQAGVVVMAEHYGIYGNTVILDHGYGLMSLYSHLSSFAVAVGDQVEQGKTLGNTGITGLAGGDHLHFGVIVHGLQVDPLEWLDANWIRTRVAAKLEPSFEVLD